MKYAHTHTKVYAVRFFGFNIFFSSQNLLFVALVCMGSMYVMSLGNGEQRRQRGTDGWMSSLILQGSGEKKTKGGGAEVAAFVVTFV